MAKKNDDQMQMRGAMCAFIGVVVLLAPMWLKSPGWREMIGGAQTVGWFAVILGVALMGVALWRRRR
ncbi:MAG: hypothetical protein J7603_03080 [Pseudacidovorax sp.]|nr:hypothetical protein [Pseudacidovorax sp.]